MTLERRYQVRIEALRTALKKLSGGGNVVGSGVSADVARFCQNALRADDDAWLEMDETAETESQ